MTILGKYSYGLHVYHHFFSYYFAKHGTGSRVAALAIQAVGGMAASMAIAWPDYFEKYFLRLKGCWPSGGTSRTVALGSSCSE